MLATAATTATVSGMEGDDEVDRNSRLSMAFQIFLRPNTTIQTPMICNCILALFVDAFASAILLFSLTSTTMIPLLCHSYTLRSDVWNLKNRTVEAIRRNRCHSGNRMIFKFLVLFFDANTETTCICQLNGVFQTRMIRLSLSTSQTLSNLSGISIMISTVYDEHVTTDEFNLLFSQCS